MAQQTYTVIGKPHLPLRTFRQLLQREHNRQLTRIAQLLDGQPPKQKKPKFVRLNNLIQEAKEQLEEWLDENVDLPVADIEAHILHYMDRMQYMLAGQNPPNA